MLARIETSVLQANMRKIKWAATQAKCLGHVVSADGCSPDPDKIQGLVAMKEPKNKRQVRRFLGGTNFYRKTWQNRSHVLAPSTALSGNATFLWNETHQKAFDDAKAIISKETMLHCPNYELPLLMFAGTSDAQLGVRMPQVQAKGVDFASVDEVLKQDYCPVLLHSRKLNDHQTNCAATDKESLRTLGSLVEHRSISHGDFFSCSQTTGI